MIWEMGSLTSASVTEFDSISWCRYLPGEVNKESGLKHNWLIGYSKTVFYY